MKMRDQKISVSEISRELGSGVVTTSLIQPEAFLSRHAEKRKDIWPWPASRIISPSSKPLSAYYLRLRPSRSNRAIESYSSDVRPDLSGRYRPAERSHWDDS